MEGVSGKCLGKKGLVSFHRKKTLEFRTGVHKSGSDEVDIRANVGMLCLDQVTQGQVASGQCSWKGDCQRDTFGLGRTVTGME